MFAKVFQNDICKNMSMLYLHVEKMKLRNKQKNVI